MGDFSELVMLLPSRFSNDGNDTLYVSIKQALAEHALPHHPGSAEKHNLHTRSPRRGALRILWNGGSMFPPQLLLNAQEVLPLEMDIVRNPGVLWQR